MTHISTGALVLDTALAYSPLKAWWFWNGGVLLSGLSALAVLGLVVRASKRGGRRRG